MYQRDYQGNHPLSNNSHPPRSIYTGGIVTVRDLGFQHGWEAYAKAQNKPCIDNESSIIQLIKGELGQKLVRRAPENRQKYDFFPLNEVLSLLQKPNIVLVLRKTFPGDDTLIEKIYQERPEHSRRMILAILILINQVESIKLFIDNGIYDGNLPLYEIEGQPHTSPFKKWVSYELFRVYQYKILVPFFNMPPNAVHFYKIEDSSIRLPFIEWHEYRNGGYGSVQKAKIHPAHHNYELAHGQPYFAIKSILKNKQGYHELQALERFSGRNKGHEHIIRLLMAIQHGNKYHLVFPLAEGNLLDLWKQDTMSPKKPTDVAWILAQCCGVADGLRLIHNGSGEPSDGAVNKGRHGDIKTENILCFQAPKGYHRLVISDFGLTDFHSSHSVSVAPEKVTGLTQFISWFLVGHNDTRGKFSEERKNEDILCWNIGNVYTEDKFFNINKEIPVLKTCVKNWISKLRTTSPDCIKEFLGLIEDGLLTPIQEERYNIDRVCVKLFEIRDDYTKMLDFSEDLEVNSSSEMAIVKCRVTGLLHKPLDETRDTQIDRIQNAILKQTRLKREAKNPQTKAYEAIDSSTSYPKISQEKPMAEPETRGSSDRLAEGKSTEVIQNVTTYVPQSTSTDGTYLNTEERRQTASHGIPRPGNSEKNHMLEPPENDNATSPPRLLDPKPKFSMRRLGKEMLLVQNPARLKRFFKRFKRFSIIVRRSTNP
ncbi:kinase-like protein [Hypoxylon fragiforme]|uniref:kinase-like protein n=1 Tax=Hypoxylon fragiforme TaxID=63214 RepID=UPI0020C5CA8A|nr:kinase-like protein [Hypoxylon fragiforme]KAI2612267.1 kinase-like protein [Hypoxylon fragiforme]